jgi:hypothetical protein
MRHLDRLPNFFILGAAKAGTTSLYGYLSQHPHVFLPIVKEPEFFCNELVFEKGIGWFAETHYSGAERFPARGDATPHYLFYEKAARRIAELLPESHHRFIVVLRNPVERAYSLYWNMVHEGGEDQSFEEALRAEPLRAREARDAEHRGMICFQYVSSGLYADQLEMYVRHFDRSRFLILLTEDLVDSPLDSARKLFEFLSIQTDVRMDAFERLNPASTPRSRMLQNALRNAVPFKRQLGKLVPFHVKHALVSKLLDWNRKPFSYPPMSAKTRTELQRRFADDVRRLEAILERDLSGWLRD